MESIDILAIGNITEDINKFENKIIRFLGGTSYYAYKVSEKLGIQTKIITELSNEFEIKNYLDLNKIIPQKAKTHTIFENHYTNGIREQVIKNKPGKILASNFKNISFSLKPKIVFYCPIFDELDSSFFNLFDGSIKVCNLQGFLRKADKGKVVLLEKIPDINFNNFDTVILSDIDTSFGNALRISKNSKIVCYTMGKYGVKIIANKQIKHYKTIDVDVVDETGAGDVWGTSFIIFFHLMNMDLDKSAKLANISASLSVRGYSDKKIATFEEIKNYLK